MIIEEFNPKSFKAQMTELKVSYFRQIMQSWVFITLRKIERKKEDLAMGAQSEKDLVEDRASLEEIVLCAH